MREYDEAINWYCGILGFRLVEDKKLTDTKRWVRRRGVVFRRSPVEEPYSTVAVFEDLYGNLWDLILPLIAAP